MHPARTGRALPTETAESLPYGSCGHIAALPPPPPRKATGQIVSNLLHFGGRDVGVCLLQLCASCGLVVEGALVLVAVAVHAAEEPLAATLEAKEPHLLVAGEAASLLHRLRSGRLGLELLGRDDRRLLHRRSRRLALHVDVLVGRHLRLRGSKRNGAALELLLPDGLLEAHRAVEVEWGGTEEAAAAHAGLRGVALHVRALHVGDSVGAPEKLSLTG
mmetsp:Transcript_65737/g.156834  ORF Transcript_65737/g.156834 Transcript_65737/m.156834 type:complete len:218 (-) Transcript_65737:7-660(-)